MTRTEQLESALRGMLSRFCSNDYQWTKEYQAATKILAVNEGTPFPSREAVDECVASVYGAFWYDVVECFPEVESGDFPPDMEERLRFTMEQAIRTWLYCNHPASPDQEVNS